MSTKIIVRVTLENERLKKEECGLVALEALTSVLIYKLVTYSFGVTCYLYLSALHPKA